LLTFDGGPSALVTLRVLERVECRYPGFLARVDMFVGTSFGGLVSLYLAHALNVRGREPLKALRDCVRFSEELLDSLRPDVRGVIRFVTGLGSMLNNRALNALLKRTFGDCTLGTLCPEEGRQVAIVAFDASKNVMTSYHNFPPYAAPEARVVDVGLACSAFSPLMPMFQAPEDLGPRSKHILLDGALVNNSVCMAGLSDALFWLASRAGSEDSQLYEKSAEYLREVMMLSTGENFTDVADMRSMVQGGARMGPNEYGVGWPTLLRYGVQAGVGLLRGSTTLDERMASQLLGPTRYCRFEPRASALKLLASHLLSPALAKQQIQAATEQAWAVMQRTYEHPEERKKPGLLRWIEEFWLPQAPSAQATSLGTKPG
jgi:hypothetical protein